MDRYVTMGAAEGWAVGEGRTLPTSLGGVAVFRAPDGFFAVSDECPHRAGSVGTGWIEGALVVCPLHEWAFDRKSGACVRGGEGASLRVVRVEERDGEIGVWLGATEEVEGPVRTGGGLTPLLGAAGGGGSDDGEGRFADDDD